MKKLGNLLNKEIDLRKSVCEIDEKAVEEAFFSVLREELPNVARADIQEFKIRNKKIFLKAVHPAVASGIWRKREKIKAKVNGIFNTKAVEDMKVK